MNGGKESSIAHVMTSSAIHDVEHTFFSTNDAHLIMGMFPNPQACTCSLARIANIRGEPKLTSVARHVHMSPRKGDSKNNDVLPNVRGV